MKWFFCFLVISLSQVHAQSILKFDKRFVECEDKWVAFQMEKDSSHIFGFIYIDAQAGLTLNYEGKFRITPENIFVAERMDSASFKIRLQPNNVKVAVIPTSKFEELEISEVPDWLSIYKETNDPIGRMVRWGYYYNAWGESKKALTYLEKAYAINPHYKGLEFELSFAYNALHEYEKAIPVLEKAILNNPAECLLYKELSYAEVNSDMLEKANETCKKGIEACDNHDMKAEIAYNLAYRYFKKKDKKQFNTWVKETKKWASKESKMLQYINIMESEIDK